MKDEYDEHIVRMQTLKESEGWKLFETVLESAAHQALAAAMKEAEPFHAAKHLGVLKTVQDLKAWPEREILIAQRNQEEASKL